MFNANKIVLTSDIAYDNVAIYTDLNTTDLPQITPNAVGFKWRSDWHITNIANIVLIHLDTAKRAIPCGYHCDRLVVDGSNNYNPVTIIKKTSYDKYGIPDVFGDKQLTFSCPDGLFITQEDFVMNVHVCPSKPGVRCGRG